MKIIYLLLALVLITSGLSAQQQQDFKIKFYCTNWGMHETWDSYCQRVKQAGFDGLETWLPGSETEKEEMFAAFKKHGLAFGFLSGGGGATFDQYYTSFVQNVEQAAQYKPDFINCHTGKDYFTFEQNKKLIDATEVIAKKYNVPVKHETHRGRFSFAAHITREFLEKIPHLSLALDISHWCNVHESLLSDQKETVALALSRTGHIHARIGHPQGPQVNDPAAPEWKATVDQHLAWWDEVIKNRKAKGLKELTITTEFGPSGYLPTLPYTQQPVADQWSINVYMLNLLKARYQQ